MIISYDAVTHETVRALTKDRPIRALRAGDPWLIACRRQSGRAGSLPGRRSAERSSRCSGVTTASATR